MRYPEIPVLSAIAAVLLLVPLPSQLRARNIPTLTLVLSTILVNVITVVNTLVWNGNTRDVAPVWCDFGQMLHLSTKNRPPTQRVHNYSLHS
jgi:pheromone a factor receptor